MLSLLLLSKAKLLKLSRELTLTHSERLSLIPSGFNLMLEIPLKDLLEPSTILKIDTLLSKRKTMLPTVNSRMPVTLISLLTMLTWLKATDLRSNSKPNLKENSIPREKSSPELFNKKRRNSLPSKRNSPN